MEMSFACLSLLTANFESFAIFVDTFSIHIFSPPGRIHCFKLYEDCHDLFVCLYNHIYVSFIFESFRCF